MYAHDKSLQMSARRIRGATGLEAWLQYLIGVIVAFHGLVYLTGGLFRMPGLFEGWKGRSLLLRQVVTGDTLTRLTRSLWFIAGIGTVATGIVIALASYAPGLWQPLGVVASVVALVSFAVSWDGQGKRSVNQGLIGALFSLAILLGAIAFPQAFS